MRYDMKEVYKLMTNKYHNNNVHVDINFDSRIKGHTKKLVVKSRAGQINY